MTSAFYVVGGSSLLLSSCKKDPALNGMMVKPVIVTEGNFSDPLVFPTIQTNNFSLTPQVSSGGMFNGNSLSGYGYQNYALLGPTLKMNDGQSFSIDVENNLSEETNLHWHGLITPAEMDGFPMDVIQPGSSFNYNFQIINRASLYWYHPHPDTKTAKQAFLGLAGLIVVNDAEEAALNLPSGNDEILLVIQDKRIEANSIIYNPSEGEIMSGYMGEYVFVNGVYAPFFNCSTKQYRVRILNGSNARVYNLALSDGSAFSIIGSDGGLLSIPENVSSVLLGPGERLDLIVDFRNHVLNTELFLISKTFFGGEAQGVQEFKIMKFIVNQISADSFSLPASLSSINFLSESQASRSRNFEISNPHGEGHGGHDMSMGHSINGKTFDAERIDEYITAGEIEVWTFNNSVGGEPHPMHLHAAQFQVLDRTGGRGMVEASEKGWKDTVLVMPEETVRVIVQFGNYSGKYVFHCHNLEHEDDGMMLNFEIT